jgi:hypothetical protein
MTYYKIDNFRYSLCQVANSKEFYQLRKQNLKVTTIVWICYGVEIDPLYIDATYEFKFPILLWLN